MKNTMKTILAAATAMLLASGARAGSYSYTYSVSGVKGMDGNLYSGPAKIWGTRTGYDWEHCEMTLADGASSGSGSTGVSGEHDNYYFFTIVDADGNTFKSEKTAKEYTVYSGVSINIALNPAGTWTPAPTPEVKYVAPTYKGTDGNPTNGIAYWTTNTCANYSLVTSVVEPSGFAWGEDGKTTWLVVADPGIVITGSPKCFGHVNLILCDGASLRVTEGIRTDSNALTIYAGCEGTGELIAEGSQNGAAGIGGGDGGIGNNIVINGGRIKTTGNGGGAGIGGGNGGSASNIVINAGVVTAIGSKGSYSGGAGIGGGSYRTGCDITINGGTVVATGVVYSAGIGGGSNNSGMRIVINDGAVQAVGGGSGAGIGGGSDGVGTNLVIRGGTVVATGGDSGAGIGGGSNAVGSDIAISGGLVLATGGNTAAGIGGGYGYDGSGSRITISSGTVTAIGGYLGAAIGGGMRGDGSQITIGGDTKVFVGGPRQLKDGLVSAADLIGCGYGSEEPAEDVAVSATAKVFFNLTGCYDENAKTMCEQVAPMPAAFDGFVLMMPERQAESRVLVGGCGESGAAGVRALPFALTNAVTGATDEIAVDGEETTFAGTYCSLTNMNGNLTFAIRPPVLTVTRQPGVANGYSIVATTDGNNGITNYAWCVQTETTTGFVVLTNALEAAREIGYTVHGGIEGTAIGSFKDDDENKPVIWLLWLPEDNASGVAGIPKGGKLHFSCVSDISADKEELLGSIHRIGETDEWVWDAKLYDVSDGEGVYSYLLMLSADEQFSIGNLRWVASSYEPVAQGATMTALPADAGVVGKQYLCRMDYGHEDVYYTGDSEVFTYETAVVAVTSEPIEHATTTVYTNGVPVTASEPGLWVLEKGVSPAKVVYAVTEAGYYFADGSTVITNDVDTSTNPATLPAAPAAPIAAVASVTTNGVTTVYSTFANAWQDATDTLHEQSGDILVTMLKDATVEESLVRSSPLANGKTFTLDLNDKVLAYAGTAAACVVKQTGGQALRIVDTAASRTPRYFTRAETGLWTLTDEVTELVTRGGLITGGRAGAVSFVYGTCAISNVNIVGNCSAANGGGVLVSGSGSDLTVTASAFLGNVAATNGGAVYTSRVCSMTDCRVEANVAGGQGGGVHLSSRGSLVRTEVVGNKAGTGGGVYLTFNPGSCFPAGVKIRMADGSEKNVEEIAKGDVVATFDHVGGTNSSAAVFYVYRGTGARQTFALSFASGAELEIADRHDLLAESTRKYVTVSSDNARQFVGRRFWNYATGGWDELVGVTAAKGEEEHYSVYTRAHGNCVANGLLTVPDDKDCFINVYELDANLKADAAQLAADIATYGLATPADYPNVPVGDFEDGNNRFARIAIGKGLVTQEELLFWFEFDYGPVSAEKPVAAPLRTLAAPQSLGSAIVKPTEPYLVIGADTVVTGNVTTAGADSNVYLYQIGKDAVIDVLPEADGFAVGVTLSSGTGMFGWTNEVNHAARFSSDNPSLGVYYTPNKTLELVRFVTVNPQPVEHASADVYLDDVRLEDEPYRVPSNSNAKVVYTVSEEGLYFADGTTAYTNDLDTAKNPAEIVGALPAAPQKPSVMVGKPVQRYPWNGVVDVRYRVKNVPAGVKVGFTVTVGATSYDGGTETTATTGLAEGVHAIDFRELGLEQPRGEATVKAAVVAE